MMIRKLSIQIAIAWVVFTGNQFCMAQFNYTPGFGIDMQKIRDEQQAMMTQAQAQIDRSKQMETEMGKKLVNEWRKKSGDWKTPDNVLLDRMRQVYFAQNPAALQQKLTEDRQIAFGYQQIHQKQMSDNFANIHARQVIRQDTANYINSLQAQAYNNRMQSMDGNTRAFNNMINERADYRNPQTGEVANLSFHHNQIQSADGQSYYTDNQGRQFLLRGW